MFQCRTTPLKSDDEHDPVDDSPAADAKTTDDNQPSNSDTETSEESG